MNKPGNVWENRPRFLVFLFNRHSYQTGNTRGGTRASTRRVRYCPDAAMRCFRRDKVVSTNRRAIRFGSYAPDLNPPAARSRNHRAVRILPHGPCDTRAMRCSRSQLRRLVRGRGHKKHRRRRPPPPPKAKFSTHPPRHLFCWRSCRFRRLLRHPRAFIARTGYLLRPGVDAVAEAVFAGWGPGGPALALAEQVDGIDVVSPGQLPTRRTRSRSVAGGEDVRRELSGLIRTSTRPCNMPRRFCAGEGGGGFFTQPRDRPRARALPCDLQRGRLRRPFLLCVDMNEDGVEGDAESTLASDQSLHVPCAHRVEQPRPPGANASGRFLPCKQSIGYPRNQWAL